MRGGVAAAALALALIAAPLAGAASRPPGAVGTMAVTASPHTPGARAVRLTVVLRYQMQCGYPGAGPLVVTFPSALKPPKRLATGAVRLAGKPVAAAIEGRQVTVTVAPHKGMLCDLVGPGSLTLVFTRKARLANPKRAGSYRFTAIHAMRMFNAKLTIKSGS